MIPIRIPVCLVLLLFRGPSLAADTAVRAASVASNALISHPEVPTKQGNWWAYYKGTMHLADESYYDPHGIDFKWAFAKRKAMPKRATLGIHLHASGGGHGAVNYAFYPGGSSDIELRVQDAETYKSAWREWWAYASDGVPYPSRRLVMALDYLAALYPLDLDNGISLYGSSMGGAGSVMQTMLLPSPWRERIAVSSGSVGIMMPRMVAAGNPAQYRWPKDDGSNDAIWDAVDFSIQAAKDPVVRGIHYRHTFSTNDQFSRGPQGNTQLEFVNLIEQNKIGGAFSWIQAKHSATERGVALPRLSGFEAKEQRVTLDRAHPAITDSTGNWPRTAAQRSDETTYPRGHYNMGITWDHSQIVDTPRELVFPLKYLHRTTIGGGIPDQPDEITISVTPRRSKHFAIVDGARLDWDWNNGEKRGTVTVLGDTVTVSGIPLASGDKYKMLRFRKAGDVDMPASTRGSAPSVPIVYSWSQRSTHDAHLKGHHMTDLSLYDPMPDVALPTGGFKEANVVDRDKNGVETTLFDCIGNDDLHCSALDPKVSPDNTKIAFAVVYGGILKKKRWTNNGDLPIDSVGATRYAQIYIYDTINKSLTAWRNDGSTLDMHPEWISNERLVFVSNRSKQVPVYIYGKSPSYGIALQMWQADIDGGNAVNVGPHDDMTLHPLVLSDGNILSAKWRVDEKLVGRETPTNLYWVNENDQFGGSEVTVLGAHLFQFRDMADRSRTHQLIAPHFYGERSNGELMSASYYRANHLGLGMNVAWERLPHGVEGAGTSLMPNLYSLTPWGQEEDNPTFKDANGVFMGNAGYPVGLPDNGVMLVRGEGYCYSTLVPEHANAEFLKGPGCNMGIYKMGPIPSRHPSDLIKIVDDPLRHEFAPDVRLPYAAVYGKPMPDQQQRTDQGFCSLKVINVRIQKLHGGKPACTRRGACIEAGYSIDDLDRLVIYQAHPNTKRQRTLRDFPVEGQRLTRLGYATPEEDGSVHVEIPCDTPYKMRGVDAAGKEFIKDQIKHSNRPGEGRMCVGCHGGHTEADAIADMDAAWKATIAANKPAQQLARE